MDVDTDLATPDDLAHADDESKGPSPFLSFLGGTVLGIAGVMGLSLAILMANAPGPDRDVSDIIPFVGSVTVLEAEAAVDAQVLVKGFEFFYEPDAVTTTGRIELTLQNEGLILHNIEFVNISGFVLEAQAGQSASSKLEMAPGSYIMFCSIPGHREAGMEGTFEVE